jgi:hypothetical protein
MLQFNPENQRRSLSLIEGQTSNTRQLLSLAGDEPKVRAVVDLQERLVRQMRRVLELHENGADPKEIDREFRVQLDLAAELERKAETLQSLT